MSDREVCIKCGKAYNWGLCPECTREANDRVVYTIIEVSKEQYDKWKGLYSGDLLAYEDCARGLITYGNKNYVVFGGSANTMETHEVVHEDQWNGIKLSYNQLVAHNGSGGPFHGNYHRFKCNGLFWVVLPDQVTRFVCKNQKSYSQMSLFEGLR